MQQPQLSADELNAIRAFREEDELTYDQIAQRIGTDVSTAHRILTKPDYRLSDLVLIRIRKRLSPKRGASRARH